MPRNNKNKNRNRGQAQAAGGAAKSTSTIGPIELEQKAAIISAGIEAAENTKSALAEAKDKLEQLQKTVNSIQVNIVQSKEKSAENVEKANPKDSMQTEEQKSDSAEAPFETQTLRKKRYRNRNKKKNGQSTGDSGVSSTDGTHESSPNAAAIDAVTSITKISEDESNSSERAVQTPTEETKIEKPEQSSPKKETNDVKIKDVELQMEEKAKGKTDEDTLIVVEKAIIEGVASNVNQSLSTNLDALKTVEHPTKEAKPSPKANKKQNQKSSTPTNESNESKKPDQHEKSKEKDTLKKNDIVESTKSEDMPKAIPPHNDPLLKPFELQEQIKNVEELVCVEPKMEQTNPAESQLKLDLLQAQSIENSDTKKNHSSKETRNAKNYKKSQNDKKNQQKSEMKPESKPETKQEEKKDSSTERQQPEIGQKTSAVNVIQETPKTTESKPNEEIAKSEPLKDKTTKVEKVEDTAKSDEIIVKEDKIGIIEISKEPLSSVTVKVEPKQDLGIENRKKIESSSSSSSLPDLSLTKTPTSTPSPDGAKSVKVPARTDDETAKIWKILEEASKSLEPVEIRMEDDQADSPPKAEEPPPITASPIVITPSDEIEAKKAAHNLMALLDSPKTTKTKEIKPEDSKSTAAKKKDQSPIKSQPRQSSESAKKDNKPHSKYVKTVQKQLKIEAPPPIEEHIPVADTEIPLDMSIISDTNIETSETVTNSKNVQGSDFVPSVEQTAVEMKSLGNENVTIPSEALECTKKEIIKPLSVDSSKQSPPKIAENPSKASKGKSNSPPMGKKPEHGNQKKNETLMSKSAEKKQEINANTTGKKTPPQQKTGKPNIPPKPDHLVSSNSKKPADKKPNQQEMKLVLGGMAKDDEDFEGSYIEYKFMPRQVFIATICQSCKQSTTSDTRVYCEDCQMVSYCCKEHQATDDALHKDFCTSIQEIAKKRGGHVYNNARILNNNDYRSLRVHTLNLCENFLKRPLQTYEREILLFPRLCSMPTCREWRQNQLTDCSNCTQVYYCTSNPDHLNETHQRWCKSVALYRKLVVTQSISGRIEPSLPSRILSKPYTLPFNIEQVFQDLYKNYSAIKDECIFATVTQLATAPLTAYFAAQMSELKIGEKFTIHLVGAELQFEADILDIWETFFLHLTHKLVELTIVFCGPELNAENIPLDIISRIRMCRTCRQNCRIVKFDFQCAKLYHDYANSSVYKTPDLICFFNPGFHHISYNGMDAWSETIKNAASAGCPVIVTSYTEYESPRDLERFQMDMAKIDKQMTLIHGPQFNAYSSQRPERNFISDEVSPLIFKNFFCFIMK